MICVRDKGRRLATGRNQDSDKSKKVYTKILSKKLQGKIRSKGKEIIVIEEYACEVASLSNSKEAGHELTNKQEGKKKEKDPING